MGEHDVTHVGGAETELLDLAHRSFVVTQQRSENVPRGT
jgi:hypothetical protein